MKSQTRRRLIIFTPLVAILVFLLWPLSDREWDISFDSDTSDKDRRLATEHRVGRSAPRIIVILADDLGPTDLSLYGGTFVRTPNIDRIGLEGVTFMAASCTSAVCAPSRVGLLTGRYQQRSGFEFQPHDQYARNRLEYLVFRYFINTDPMVPMSPAPIPRASARMDQGLAPNDILLSELLRARGYRTAVFGKWHLGYRDDVMPLRRGFDTHFGFYEAFSLYAPVDDPTIVNTPIDDFSDRHMWKHGRSGFSELVEDGRAVDEPDYLTFAIADRAANYITAHSDEPFFLYLPFSAPHTPLQVPVGYHDRASHLEDPIRRTYYAMISALDDAVGTVIDAVSDAGIEESTMIVFASDNGGVTYLGVTENGPYAGGKFSTFEGGLSVPLMIRYPGVIPEGSVYGEPVSLLDIFPTVANRSALTDLNLDGVDLIPFVTGEREGAPHEALFWRSGYNGAARTGPWKLIIQGVGAPDTATPLELLYNLADDPYEQVNLAHQHPDIVDDLRGRYDTWSVSLAPPTWPPVMHFRMNVWEREYWFGI